MTERVPGLPSILDIPDDLDITDAEAMMRYEFEIFKSGEFEKLGITDEKSQELLRQYLEEINFDEVDLEDIGLGSEGSEGSEDGSSKESIEEYFASMESEQLRQLLVDSGYPTEILQQMSDAELQQALQMSFEDF